MQKLKIIAALICSISTNLYATTYYVSLSGNDSNTGKSTTAAWRTLKHAAAAATNLQPGDIVYVKAGDYGNENIVFAKDGIAGKPITFQGYKTTPGDIPPVIVTTATAGTIFNTTDMPTYTGSNRASGAAFNCQYRKFLVFKNFQIRKYEYAFLAGGPTQNSGNLILNNVNVMTLGSTNSSAYSGQGFGFGNMGTKFSNNNILTNCLVINSAAEGFIMCGNKNTLSECKVFCNENVGSAATDYYIMLCGDSNTVAKCHVERLAGISHNGHGIGAKTNAEQVIDDPLNNIGIPPIAARYNTFNNCTAINMGESFYVRHRTAQFNLFYHCKAIGTHTGAVNSSEGEGCCIITRDGASSNTFDGCVAENCAAGFVFSETVEDGDTGTNPLGHPGNYNKYLNCIINNCYLGVKFITNIEIADAGDNTIANCTFYKTRYIHYAESHCTKMKYIGNIYYGCLPTVSGGYFKGSTYASDILPNGTDTYFKQCDFINIQGGVPSGYIGINGNINSNPSFINAASKDFHLNSISSCIDKVNAISLASNPKDFDNTDRYSGIRSDIGAFEFDSASIVGIQPESFVHNKMITIYPNPSNGLINIVSQLDATYHINVINVLGESVYESTYTTQLNINHLKSGIYFLQILEGDGKIAGCKKICIQ